jgi:hypothetical protein
MSYDSQNLSVLAYANGFTLWHYTTADPASDVDDAGYFDEAADMVRVGDMIMANVDTDGTPAAGMFVVASNVGGEVDVTNLTPFGTADTD